MTTMMMMMITITQTYDCLAATKHIDPSYRLKLKGAYGSLRETHHSHGASPVIWDHTVLPATQHRWTHLTLTPAKQAGTWFTYPGGMEGWDDLGVGYKPRWFTCPHTVTHPGSNTWQRPDREPSSRFFDPAFNVLTILG